VLARLMSWRWVCAAVKCDGGVCEADTGAAAAGAAARVEVEEGGVRLVAVMVSRWAVVCKGVRRTETVGMGVGGKADLVMWKSEVKVIFLILSTGSMVSLVLGVGKYRLSA
jgi:hypothetical protein